MLLWMLYMSPWAGVWEFLDIKLLQGNAQKLGCNITWAENFQMEKLDLEKAEEPDIKLPKSVGL